MMIEIPDTITVDNHGFYLDPGKASVFLNGERVEHPVAFNIKEGWVEHYAWEDGYVLRVLRGDVTAEGWLHEQ